MPAPPPLPTPPPFPTIPPAFPTPPPEKPPYDIPPQALRSLVLTLPRPSADAPDAAWQEVVQDNLEKLAAFDPRDAIETMLATGMIALSAGMLDALRLAFEQAATPEQALRQRANAVGLHRAINGTAHLLDRQRRRPAAPARDWADAAATLTTEWRAAPSRPAEAAHGGKAEAESEVVVRWIDEIDDAELAIAVEDERRQKAGEPPLPRKPGAPMVLYRYKPEDYVHQFRPDPKNFRKYPGWENMTMAERRDFFGYSYDGPLGPAEALTPASRDAMLAQQAAEEKLKQEYGM